MKKLKKLFAALLAAIPPLTNPLPSDILMFHKRRGRERVPPTPRFRERLSWCEAAAGPGRSGP